MDLALNNLQGLICHKTQTNKQPTNQLTYLFTKKIITAATDSPSVKMVKKLSSDISL